MRRAIAPLTLLALLAGVAPASATIVVQKSIAGVRLGMKESQVRSVLGKPTKVTAGRDKITGQKQRLLTYAKTKMTVTLIGGDKVTSVRTTGTAERTSGGIGVGSTEAALRQKVKGVKCVTYKSGTVSYRICSVGVATPGKTTTVFGLSKAKKLESIQIGYVID